VFNNLLDNALKFTEKAEIHFGYQIINKAHAPYYKLYVKDTGIGISFEQQTTIFNSFTKTEMSGQKLYQGVRLGFSICKSFEETIGGRIGAESEPNKGSTFFFIIPFTHKIIDDWDV